MKAQTQRRLRQFHRYSGLFFAPAILFFAFSGAIQTIGLQDRPSPPRWISAMAGIHKKQSIPAPRVAKPRPRPESGAAAPRREEHDEAGSSAIPLKAFVLLLSIGLILSTALGIAIAFSNQATRRGATIALAAGLILPVLLLLV